MAGDELHLPTATRPPVFARTKFLVPPQRDTVVARSALRSRLVAAEPLPLTLVVGSPGSGKTSLLSEWFRATDDGTNAWLAADRGDGDPTRFWQGLIRAVQQVDPTFGVEAADLITLDGEVSSDALEALLTDDAGRDERIRLVIDDFHLVSLDAAEQLFHLLERGLAHVRLLLGSRSDPVGVHRLRVRDAVHEVRETDLRLDADETRQMVERLGLDPAGIDLEALHRRTEGWAAGVQLAAVALRGADDPVARLRELTGTAQTIAGYLTAEVLATQPPEVQRFLEDTCVVDEIDTAMAAALVPDDPGAPRVTLTQIEEANLMLSRIDRAGTVFRYHHLFGEMLRHRLEATAPERFREQHHRAAQHPLAEGDVNSAVRHLWLAGRTDEAANAMRFRMVDVLSAPDAPPPVDPRMLPTPEQVAAAPGDAVGFAVGLMMNNQAAPAAQLLRVAEEAAIANSSPPIDLMHVWGARIAAELMNGETAESVRCARSVRTLAVTEQVGPDDWQRVSLHFGARSAVWEGDLALAEELLAMSGTHPDERIERVDVASVRAFVACEHGQLGTAIAVADAAHAAAQELGVTGNGADLAARAVRGTALLDRGDIDAAERDFRAVVDGRRTERVPSFVLAATGLARVHRVRGDFDAALRVHELSRARLRSLSPGTTLVTRLTLGEVAVRLALGDFDRCAQLLDGAADGFRTTLAHGWLHALRHEWDAAERVLDQLARTAASPRDHVELATLQLRRALDGDTGDADERATALLDLAEPLGMVVSIAEAGTAPMMAAAAAAKRRPRTAYVDRLTSTRPLPRPAEHARPAFAADELSNRELIVLRYMATSMSNQEIAEALFLSVNTVKTHIKHVLRKLGATSRVEATQRAQDLHYL